MWFITDPCLQINPSQRGRGPIPSCIFLPWSDHMSIHCPLATASCVGQPRLLPDLIRGVIDYNTAVAATIMAAVHHHSSSNYDFITTHPATIPLPLLKIGFHRHSPNYDSITTPPARIHCHSLSKNSLPLLQLRPPLPLPQPGSWSKFWTRNVWRFPRSPQTLTLPFPMAAPHSPPAVVTSISVRMEHFSIMVASSPSATLTKPSKFLSYTYIHSLYSQDREVP